MDGYLRVAICKRDDLFLDMDWGAIVPMTACTAMFPQCMTRVNNPKDCDCPKEYRFRSDPDETRGRRMARAQANADARRSIGRKATLMPLQSKPDQADYVSNPAVSDIAAPAKSKQDQNMKLTDLPGPITPRIALTVEQVGQIRGAVESEIETRFWSIVDRNGLSGLPSDMWEALDILARRAGL